MHVIELTDNERATIITSLKYTLAMLHHQRIDKSPRPSSAGSIEVEIEITESALVKVRG